MRTLLRTPRRRYGRYPRHALRPHLEALESRTLPMTHGLTGAFTTVLESEPNDTIDQAQSLGDLSSLQQIQVDGTVGRGASGDADVDWYRFTLDRPSVLTVATRAGQPGHPLASVFSLYGNSTPDPHTLADQANYRLLVQDDGALHDGNARLDRELAAGTYFVAVSGKGNRYFHPLIAGSGYPGSTGDYALLLQAADLGLRSADGPVVLASDPAPGANLARSPFDIRIDLSTALAPASIRLGSNVQLRSTGGTGSNATTQAVLLAASYFDKIADELVLTPAAPLRSGQYQLSLAGQRGASPGPLEDSAGDPLGKNDLHPSGNDFTLSFRISGIKGNQAPTAGADDTPATAQQVGELAGAGLVQIAGAIGDDPTAPIPFSPADVDLYHFHIRGSGRFAFTAEVFAGRIGSTLDPALSLFRLDPTDHQLDFVASNDNSFNPTVTHDGKSVPLFTDPLLNTGLTEGDYYLAVSASNNVPMPAFGRLPGTGGVFDPSVSHSGKNGSTIGDYVLNLAAEAMNNPPHVRGVPIVDGSPLTQGAILAAPPTSLSVAFGKTVNLRELIRQTGLPTVDAITIQDSQGRRFFPHLVSYTESDQRADFLMYDALPNGVYELHLSSARGLTDLAGNPLVGNDPGGDYVVRFTVNGPVRGSNGNPRQWLGKEPNDDPAHPQDLGVLFPTELQTGVFVERGSPVAGASDAADYYQFRILQNALFAFALTSSPADPGTRLSLRDASGNAIPMVQSHSRGLVEAIVNLKPGTYLLGISGWSPSVAAQLTYRLSLLSFGQEQEPTIPLSVGPGPAIWIHPLTRGPSAAYEAPVSAASISGTTAVQAKGPDLGAIPSGVILLLAAGPVGGPGSSPHSPQRNDPYQNILARTPDILLAQVVARLPLLVPFQPSGIAQESLGPGELMRWLQTVFHQFEKVNWFGALDFIYGSREWQERIRIRPVQARPPDLPENQVPDDGAGEPMAAAGENRPSQETLWDKVSPVWMMAAAIAAGAAREPGRRRRRRRVRR